MKTIVITIVLAFPMLLRAGENLKPEGDVQYQSKYAFSVPYTPPHVESHPDGIHTVRAKFSIRECDTEGGEVVLLAFYKDSTLLKSYTLKELWPKPEDRRFHPASGVFGWVAWHPTINTFRGNIFSICTIDDLLRFDMTSGARLETKTEQVESREP